MANSQVFIKGHEFDPKIDDTIQFSQCHRRDNSQFGTVDFKYFMNKLLIQTPKLVTPFGFSTGFPGSHNEGKDFHIQLTLDSKTDKSKKFLEALRQFEELIVNYAYENRGEWGLYGNKTEAESATLEDVKCKFRGFVNQRNPEYDPRIKLGFRTRFQDGNRIITSKCHDERNRNLTPSKDTIPGRSPCIAIITATSVWISPSQTFGVKWTIETLKVYPIEKPEAPKGIPIRVDGPKIKTSTNQENKDEACLFGDDDSE